MGQRVRVFDERFDAGEVDPDRWVTHYLPQWTTPERSAARYRLTSEGLRLLIERDQPAWREEDGAMRVSGLQTGVHSGPVGSPVGTHRHTDGLAVVTEQPTRRLFLPVGGRVEAELRATPDPTVMLAFWLVGFEESPDECGEICVAELLGHAATKQRSQVNLGVKAHSDPRLVTDMRTVDLAIDATTWHLYAAEWHPDQPGISFFVDDQLVHRSPQRLGYPMQLMVDLFEFRDPTGGGDGYPKTGDVRSVRAHTIP
jgi:hypothetical protein